jgi:hypothetical protein
VNVITNLESHASLPVRVMSLPQADSEVACVNLVLLQTETRSTVAQSVE